MAAQPSPREFQPYRQVQAAAEKELTAILETTAKAIEKRVASLRPGIGGVVRAAQLRLILAEIRRLQRAMWTARITPVMQRQIDAAVEAGESAVEALTRVAYGALSEPAAAVLMDGLRAAAQSGFKSDAARKKRALSERVYRQRALHEGKVEQIIRQGIISSLSAKELAADVYKYVSPTTPGGASYAAMRLARTEINNAFHERQIAGANRPGVEAVQWNLSGSHKVPDECNVYAAHKPYPPDGVPEKPHPQCFCYLTYVTTPPEEFRAKLEAGGFDNEIARRTRENMARLGQKVGPIEPVEVDIDDNLLTGDDAHAIVPKGLFKRGSMTPKQRKALGIYETGWFIVIQNFLRERQEIRDKTDQQTAETVSQMDSAMVDSVLSKPILAYRGLFKSKLIFGDRLDNDLEGFTWRDRGYGSVTTEKKISRIFVTGSPDPNSKPVQGAVQMTVRVAPGVSGLQTSTSDKGSKANGPLAEITLQRDLVWTVTKDNGYDAEGIRQIEVQVDRQGESDDPSGAGG